MARFNPGLELRLDDRGPCNAANADTACIDSRKACRKRGVSLWACRGFVSKVEAFVRGRGALEPSLTLTASQTGSSGIISRENDERRLRYTSPLIPRAENRTDRLLIFPLSKRIR